MGGAEHLLPVFHLDLTISRWRVERGENNNSTELPHVEFDINGS